MSIYLTDRPCPARGAPLASDGRVDRCLGIDPLRPDGTWASNCTYGIRQDAPAPSVRPTIDAAMCPPGTPVQMILYPTGGPVYIEGTAAGPPDGAGMIRVFITDRRGPTP